MPRSTGRLHGMRGAAVLFGIATALALAALAGVELIAGRLLARSSPPPAIDLDGDYVAAAALGIDLGLNPVPLLTDPVLLWRNRPGAVKQQPVNPRLYGRDATWTARIDPDGYRGPALSARRADGYRVLCVGDSITFGFNVEQEETFARRLEGLLRQRHPGRVIEVVNAGVAGWSWAQGLRYLETRGLALHPDAVIMAHGTNDQFFRATTTDLEYLAPGRTRLGRLAARIGTLLSGTNTARLITRRAGARPEPSPRCRAQGEVCRRVSLPEITVLVGEAARQVRAAGADFVVLNVDFMATAAVTGVREAVAAESIPFIDFVERFRDLREADDKARAARLGLAPPGPIAGTPAADGTQRLVLRVTAVPPGEISVAGDVAVLGGHPFEARMRDDGTGGDEVAGDGVFSATVALPPNLSRMTYRFAVDGVPEAVGLPPLPSQFGGRAVEVAGDTRAPIAVFGNYFLMSEQTHPDGHGHAVIAEVLADTIEELPSFRRFVERGTSSAASPPR